MEYKAHIYKSIFIFKIFCQRVYILRLCINIYFSYSFRYFPCYGCAAVFLL